MYKIWYKLAMRFPKFMLLCCCPRRFGIRLLQETGLDMDGDILSMTNGDHVMEFFCMWGRFFYIEPKDV